MKDEGLKLVEVSYHVGVTVTDPHLLKDLGNGKYEYMGMIGTITTNEGEQDASNID